MLFPESASDVKFEIGHVLFIDIVGYSKLLITEQSEQIQRLKEIVRGTEQFRAAEAEGKVLAVTYRRWWGARLSNYSRGTSLMCARDQQGAKKTSRASRPHGHS